MVSHLLLFLVELLVAVAVAVAVAFGRLLRCLLCWFLILALELATSTVFLAPPPFVRGALVEKRGSVRTLGFMFVKGGPVLGKGDLLLELARFVGAFNFFLELISKEKLIYWVRI